MEYRSYDIQQIMAAPGWKYFTAGITDGKVWFAENPVIGWGIVQKVLHDDERDIIERRPEREVELLTWIDGVVEVAEDFAIHSNSISRVYPPDSQLDDSVKKELQKQLHEYVISRGVKK